MSDFTTPCYYFVSGFWPKRRWFGQWEASFPNADGMARFIVRAWTCRGLFVKACAVYEARGVRSVSMRENHRQLHPNGPGKPNSRRPEPRHNHGEPWHREGCPHGAVYDGEQLGNSRALGPLPLADHDHHDAPERRC